MRLDKHHEALLRSPFNRSSFLGEVAIPVFAAAIPAFLFLLLGFVTRRIDGPGTEASLGIVVAIVVIQTLGIVSMALVVIVRCEVGSRLLQASTHGRPSAWRKGALELSLASLIMFDVLANVATAFPGGEFLLIGAGICLATYLIANRIAFAGLGNRSSEHQSSA